MANPLQLEVNGKHYTVNYPGDTPLLYVLRDELGLTGTKYGCGEGQCGACTVLLDGAARRSFQIPLSSASLHFMDEASSLALVAKPRYIIP